MSQYGRETTHKKFKKQKRIQNVKKSLKKLKLFRIKLKNLVKKQKNLIKLSKLIKQLQLSTKIKLSIQRKILLKTNPWMTFSLKAKV